MNSPLIISPSAKISPLADLEISKRNSLIRIGDDSNIDSFVKIKAAGGEGDLVIGERTFINSGCVLYTGNGISIGDDVLIAANCTLAPVNHAFKKRECTVREQGFQQSRGGIVIENDVWIGANSVILDGAVIRKGCIVGACSLVRGELPAYSVCYGSPATAKGTRK